MIAGAYGISSGPLHRMNHVWGWGQLFLARVLPVVEFSGATVSGLIVHDRPGDVNGDGTADGVSHLLLPSTLPTTTTFYSADFHVLDTDEDLVVALAWLDDDTLSGVVQNHLDLEVRDCGADETCGNSDDTIWNGGAFSEDWDEDGTLETQTKADRTVTIFEDNRPSKVLGEDGNLLIQYSYDPERHPSRIYLKNARDTLPEEIFRSKLKIEEDRAASLKNLAIQKDLAYLSIATNADKQGVLLRAQLDSLEGQHDGISELEVNGKEARSAKADALVRGRETLAQR